MLWGLLGSRCRLAATGGRAKSLRLQTLNSHCTECCDQSRHRRGAPPVAPAHTPTSRVWAGGSLQLRSACDIKKRAAGLVCATSATKSSQPVPANRSNSPPFIYRRATKSTNHRSVKFLDGVQALRGWDGTIFGLSASVSTSYAARGLPR